MRTLNSRRSIVSHRKLLALGLPIVATSNAEAYRMLRKILSVVMTAILSAVLMVTMAVSLDFSRGFG